jgi:hypothetical protein
MTEQVKHLLGGYATGTLTPEENAALMQAALEDQELFDALADDESLRRYLAEPEFRKDLLKATASKPSGLRWIAALGAAAACLFAALIWTTHRPGLTTQKLAMNQSQVAAPPPAAAYGVQSIQAKPPVPKKTANRKPQAPAVGADHATSPAPAPGPVAASTPPATAASAQAVTVEASRAFDSQAASTTAGQLSANGPLPRAAFAPKASVMAKAELLRPPVHAQITDVNGAIVTIDKGSTADVRAGDLLDVVHDNLKVGFIVITTAEPGFSVGRYSGSVLPLIGDTAQTPKK